MELKKIKMGVEERFKKLEKEIIANSSFGKESLKISSQCDQMNILFCMFSKIELNN